MPGRVNSVTKCHFVFQLEKNKGFAEDLTEGKFSFPIIHGIRSHPENNQIMNILLYILKPICYLTVNV